MDDMSLAYGKKIPPVRNLSWQDGNKRGIEILQFRPASTTTSQSSNETKKWLREEEDLLMLRYLV